MDLSIAEKQTYRNRPKSIVTDQTDQNPAYKCARVLSLFLIAVGFANSRYEPVTSWALRGVGQRVWDADVLTEENGCVGMRLVDGPRIRRWSDGVAVGVVPSATHPSPEQRCGAHP